MCLSYVHMKKTPMQILSPAARHDVFHLHSWHSRSSWLQARDPQSHHLDQNCRSIPRHNSRLLHFFFFHGHKESVYFKKHFSSIVHQWLIHHTEKSTTQRSILQLELKKSMQTNHSIPDMTAERGCEAVSDCGDVTACTGTCSSTHWPQGFQRKEWHTEPAGHAGHVLHPILFHPQSHCCSSTQIRTCQDDNKASMHLKNKSQWSCRTCIAPFPTANFLRQRCPSLQRCKELST